MSFLSFQLCLLFLLIARCMGQLTPEQTNQVQNIAVKQINFLSSNVSDFNALNDNYLDKKRYFEELKQYEIENGEYVHYGFSLQSMETYDNEGGVNLFNMTNAIFFGQIIFSVFDVNETASLFNIDIKYNEEKDRFTFLGYEAHTCAINILFSDYFADNKQIYSHLNCLLDSSSNQVVTFNKIELNIRGNAQSKINALFDFTDIHNYIRFSKLILSNNPDTYINDVYANLERNLNLTSIIALSNAYYAYWEMTQQQILDSIDLNGVENSLLSNVLILNKEIYDIQDQLSYLPFYKRVVINEYYSKYNQKELTNLVTACNINQINTYLDGKMSFYAHGLSGQYFCSTTEHKNENCSFGFIFNTQYSCPLPKTVEYLSVPFDTSEGQFNLELEVIFDLNISRRFSYYIDVNGQYTDNGDKTLDISNLPKSSEFPIIMELVNRPFLNLGTYGINILDPQFKTTVKVLGLIETEIRLFNPTFVQKEFNQNLVNGIEFDFEIFSQKSNAFLYKSGHSFNTLSLKQTSRTCSQATFSTNPDLSSNDGEYVIGTGLESYNNVGSLYWIRCKNPPPLTIRFNELKFNNDTLHFSGQVNDIFFAIAKDNIPQIYYSESLSNVQYQLQVLSDQVDNLEQRVTNLEDSGKDFFNTLLDIFSIFSTSLDFISNIYDKSKYIVKLAKTARNSLRKTTADGTSIASEFQQVLKKVPKISSEYNPVEAINQAAVFNYQSSLYKSDWRSLTFSKTKLTDLDYNTILKNPLDTREIIQTNSALYLKFQKLAGENVKFPSHMQVDNFAFGYINAHSSPIEQIPVVGKYLHSSTKNSEKARSFLSNQYQKLPFHTSVSIKNFEIEKDGKIVYNIRFTGVGEPSIIGPTNLKNPRVKIGYTKIQYDVVDNNLVLRNWDKTKIVDNRVYTKEEVKELYLGFTHQKETTLNTDDQWKYLSIFVDNKIKSRNVIDRIPLPNDIFLQSLDDLTFFSSVGNNFKYNLFNNNCQNFVKVYTQLASKGYSNLKLSASDFSEYAKIFSKYSLDYVSNYMKPLVNSFMTYKDRLIQSFNSFKILL